MLTRYSRLLEGTTLVMLLALIVATLMIAEMSLHSGCGMRETASTQAMEISKAISTFRVMHGRFPTMDEGLPALTSGKRPIMERLPIDPWGTPYRYAIPGWKNPFKFDVTSAGPDRRFNAEDDQGNWPSTEDGEAYSERFLAFMARW